MGRRRGLGSGIAWKENVQIQLLYHKFQPKIYVIFQLQCNQYSLILHVRTTQSLIEPPNRHFLKNEGFCRANGLVERGTSTNGSFPRIWYQEKSWVGAVIPCESGHSILYFRSCMLTATARDRTLPSFIRASQDFYQGPLRTNRNTPETAQCRKNTRLRTKRSLIWENKSFKL